MAYSVMIKQFEGPLDLLLSLIEKAQVDIRDIFVSEITSQYLEYINAAPDLDLENASEFLIMAARLVFIKSRSILPRLPFEEEYDEYGEEDPEVLLIRQLQEYKAYKDAAQGVEIIYESALGIFEKLPEEFVLPQQVTLFKGGTTDELYRAFIGILSRVDDKNIVVPFTHEVLSDTYTIRSCTVEIREMLRARAFIIDDINAVAIEFNELFIGATTRMRVIVMFMALLEMLMRGEIMINQEEAFSPLVIVPSLLKHDDKDERYMDEIEDTINNSISEHYNEETEDNE